MKRIIVLIAALAFAFASPVYASGGGGGHGSGGGGSSSSSSSTEDSPLGGNPGVQLPALVVPMIRDGRQAGYFYLTMSLEVSGNYMQLREYVPNIMDRLVRWVHQNPIDAGLTQEQALDIISEQVVQFANEEIGGHQVTGLVYRDVSTGF